MNDIEGLWLQTCKEHGGKGSFESYGLPIFTKLVECLLDNSPLRDSLLALKIKTGVTGSVSSNYADTPKHVKGLIGNTLLSYAKVCTDELINTRITLSPMGLEFLIIFEKFMAKANEEDKQQSILKAQRQAYMLGLVDVTEIATVHRVGSDTCQQVVMEMFNNLDFQEIMYKLDKGFTMPYDELKKLLQTNKLYDNVVGFTEFDTTEGTMAFLRCGSARVLEYIQVYEAALKHLQPCQYVQRPREVGVTTPEANISPYKDLNDFVRGVCRKQALAHKHQHSYLPQTLAEADTFEPHRWVKKACLEVAGSVRTMYVGELGRELRQQFIREVRECIQNAIDNSNNGEHVMDAKQLDILVEVLSEEPQ